MNHKSNEWLKLIASLSEERKTAMLELRKTIKANIPDGFEESIHQNMLHFVIPHSIYEAGYHCEPTQPLPFISLASQKNFIALYHMGIYIDLNLLAWFKREYPNHCKTKLDMGKSCIRFKKMEDIPYMLIAELCGKINVKQWIHKYEENFRPKD